MSEVRRALIVGCGNIAGGYNSSSGDAMILTHAAAYARHPDHELAACVDPDVTARRDFMRKWNVPRGYSTLDEALSAEHFDVVSVCGPTGTHLAALARLVDADLKAVFAEKPLDGNPEGARRIGGRFEMKGIPVAVNFTRRFDAAMHRLRNAVRAGEYEVLCSAIGWYSGDIVNNGSHLIDLVAFLTDRVPALVDVVPTREARAAADANVTAVLDLQSLPFLMIGCDARSVSRFELELTFGNAIVTIEESGLTTRTRRFVQSDIFPAYRVPSRGQWAPTQYGSAMLAALDELVQWQPGAQLSSDIASACEAIELATTIHRRALEIIT